MSADQFAAADDQEPPESGLNVEIAAEAACPASDELIRAAVAAALPADRYQAASISVAVVDDPTMHELNRQYLAHDYPTDVLSFALLDEPPQRLEGQIIVSVDTAAACAADAGWSAADEVLLYVIHGTLHLAGHDDHSPEAAAAMLAAEAAALAELGIERSPGDERWTTGAGAYCTANRTTEDR